jgi:hypothetical protein
LSRQDTISPEPIAAPESERAPRRVVVYAGIATGIVLVLVMAGLVAWRLDGSKDPVTSTDSAVNAVKASWARTPVSRDGLAARTGVRIKWVAVTGGGGLIDLRYQVVNPDLAAVLHNPANPPALIDEASGLVVRNLLMDHAHKGIYQPGITYPLIFENPGSWVHTGSKVTVLLGDAEVDHVIVQ